MASYRNSENGFVLLGAIWLLVLAGTVGAALLLRSMGEARTAATEGRALADRLALDGAAEAAFASLLFHGQASPLAAGEGSVTVGGWTVSLSLTSETERFDVNEADPALIGRALHTLAVPAGERSRIADRVALARGEGRRLSSPAELRQLLGPASPGLEDVFTLHSGLAQPTAGEAPESLARRLAAPAAAANPVELRGGAPLRVDAVLPSGARLTAVARLTGLQDDPVAVHRWEHRFSRRTGGEAFRPGRVALRSGG